MAQSKTKSVLLLSFAQNLNLVLNILSYGILARLFSQSDLGIYKQTIMVYELISPFLLLGIPDSVYYFLQKEYPNKTIFNTFLLVFISGLITFLCIFFGRFFFAEYFNDIELIKTLKVFSFIAFFQIPLSIISPILISLGKSDIMSIWSVITNFLMLLGILTTAFFTGNYYKVLVLNVVVQCFNCIVGIILIEKLTNPKILDFKIDFTLIKQILKYALPLGLTTLMGSLYIKLDKTVVSMFVSPDKFAIYSNGATEIPFINTITGCISAVIIVDYIKLYNNKEMNKIVELFRTCAYKTSLILFPIMAYFIFWNNEFIVILYSEKYSESSLFFFVYLFTIPVRIVQYGPVIQAMNKNFLLVIRSIFDLITNVIFNFIFVHFFGMIGAALATVFVLYFWHVPFNLIVIAKGLNTKVYSLFPIKKLLLVFCISLIISSTSLFFKFFTISFLFKLFLSSVYCTLLYLPVLYFIDKQSLLSIIKIFLPTRIKMK